MTGSTVFASITRARITRPFVLLRTCMISCRRPAASASPATCTSTPVLRATIATFVPRRTSNGSINQRRLTGCPLRSARRLVLPATSAGSEMASSGAVTSRRSRASDEASITSPARKLRAAVTTSALIVARTTNSLRHSGSSQLASKRMRVTERVSIGSICAFAVQGFTASRANTVSSTEGLRKPAVVTRSMRCVRAARSTSASMPAGVIARERLHTSGAGIAK